MAIDLAQLVVSMEANTAKFQKDMERVEKRLYRFERNTFATVRNIRNAFIGLGIGVLLREVIQSTDGIGDSAKRLGLTARAYQELRYAAVQLDVDVGELDVALGKFNKTLGDAKRGSPEAAKAFKQLGLDPAQFKDADQAFAAVTKRLGEIDDHFVRTSLQAQLFGKEAGPKLAEFIGASAAEVSHLRAEAERLGLVMSEQTIDAADKAQKQLETFSTFIKTQLAKSFTQLTPIIVDATKALMEFMMASKPLSSQELAGQRKELERLRAIRSTLEGGGLTPEQVFDMTGQSSMDAALRYIDQRIMGQVELLAETQRRMSQKKPEAPGEKKPLKIQTEEEIKVENEHAKALEKARSEVLLLSDAEGEAAQMRALVNELYAQGKIPQDAYLAFLEEASQKLDDLGAKDVEEKMSIAAEQAVRNIQSFTASLVDAALAGDDMGDAIVGALRRIAAEMLTVQILQSIGTAIGGSFGAALAGARADGGPVSGGKSYLVGEEGPEIFTPNVSGAIIPNDAMGGGGANVTISVDARGADAQAAANFVRGSMALAAQIEAKVAEGLSRGRYKVAAA